MLYVTTRSNSDYYTAHRAASESRGPDGGIYVPYKIIPFSDDELMAFAELSVNQCLGKVLDRLLGVRLSGVDLDLYIGRNPVRLKTLRQRIAVGETWHNADGDFRRLVEDVGKSFSPGIDAPAPWLEMSVRIAVLFAIYGELLRKGQLDPSARMDVSLVSGNFFGPMSVWFAREMGLPVENIVCCCNENNGLWNLIYHGELRTDQSCISSRIPEADVNVPDGLECLISACCGKEEVHRYLDAVRLGRMYCPQTRFDRLRRGFHVSVISGPGTLRTIPNVFSSYGTVLASPGAMAYAGLLDYRARTGENRFGLIIADRSPETDMEVLSEAFQMDPERVRQWLNKM